MGASNGKPPAGYHVAPGPDGSGQQQYQPNFSKSAPPPPDYQGAAQTEAQASQQNVAAQTQANRPDINTPFGQQQWQQGPDGQWHMQTGFSGGLGALAGNLTGQATDAMSKPFDPNSFGPIGNGDQARNQAINGAYSQATSRLDPMFQQEEQQLDTKLANQGLDPTTAAAQTMRGNFARTKNDAYSSAMNGAIAQGTAAGDSVFRNNAMANQLAIANALRGRTQAMGDLQGMQGLLSMPGFNAAGMAQSPNYLSAAVAGGNYGLANAEMQNQLMGSMFGAGGGALGSLGSLALL